MHRVSDQAPTTQGLAALARLIFEGGDIQAASTALANQFAADVGDCAALFDLATLVQLGGDRENGMALQDAALGLNRLYLTRHGDGSGLRVLALMAPGDMMANTPLDFLLEGSDVQLLSLYLDPAAVLPQTIPDHDVAVLTVGESDANQGLLAGLGAIIGRWPRPMLNGRPDRISGLTRDRVSALFADEPSILCPQTVRVDRAALADAAAGATFPMIIRPVWSHAGRALERIDDAASLIRYLEGQVDDAFFVSPFIDYAGADGLYRKQRIVFIDGEPHVAHMAISEHWMVHYLSAGMLENAERRAEEAAFMADFDTDFRRRHSRALKALHERLGLDYFGIDCAETQDGRLLLFEADVAMIVHDLDPAELYPYKKPQMRKVFDAFEAFLRASA